MFSGYNCPELVSFCWITSQIHGLQLLKKFKLLNRIFCYNRNTLKLPIICVYTTYCGVYHNAMIIDVWFILSVPSLCVCVCVCTCVCLVTQSCPTLCDLMDCGMPGSSVYGISQVRNTGVGCHFFLQRTFLSQGLNPCLLHCRQILYLLSH